MRLDEGHVKGFFLLIIIKKKSRRKKVENQVTFSARVGFFDQNIFMKFFMCHFHCLFIDSCNRLLGGLIGDQRGLHCL